MRQTLFILVLNIMCITINAQIPVFDYDKNGRIKENTAFIDSFVVDPFINKETSPLTYQTVKTISVSDGINTYAVNLNKCVEYTGDPGDYHAINITRNGKSILNLTDDDGWDFFYIAKDYKKDTSNPIRIIDLTSDCKALVFTGITISSQPPIITIVTISKGKATLVYNKPSYIDDIKTYNNTIEYYLRLISNESDDNGIPYDTPQLARLIFKNGMIFYKDMSNPEEYDLKELEPRF